MLVTDSGISIAEREVHPLNADPPMLVTPSGIVIEIREVQSSNVDAPILVIYSGSSIVEKDVRLKAHTPILLKLFGKFIDIRLVVCKV